MWASACPEAKELKTKTMAKKRRRKKEEQHLVSVEVSKLDHLASVESEKICTLAPFPFPSQPETFPPDSFPFPSDSFLGPLDSFPSPLASPSASPFAFPFPLPSSSQDSSRSGCLDRCYPAAGCYLAAFEGVEKRNRRASAQTVVDVADERCLQFVVVVAAVAVAAVVVVASSENDSGRPKSLRTAIQQKDLDWMASESRKEMD